MSTGKMKALIGTILVVALLAGCAASGKKATPKAPEKGKTAAPTAKEKAPTTPKEAAAPATPKEAPAAQQETPAARPKDVLSAFQNVPLKVVAGDKVWVVSVEGRKPRDVRATLAAEAALRRIVTERDKATLVESAAPALTALLELYLMKPVGEISDTDLVAAARTAGATKVLAFRARAAAPPGTGPAPFQPPTAAEEPMSVEARVIEVAGAKVAAAAEVSTSPAPVSAPSAVRAYPFRVTEPQYVSRPDVPKPKKESNLMGRRFRAYTRFNDQISPFGVYDNPDYQNWTLKNDNLFLFPLYSGDASLIIITSTPPNARVYVNGQDTGLTPCWLPLEEGDRVVLFKEGFMQEEFRVPEKQSTMHVNLRPR